MNAGGSVLFLPHAVLPAAQVRLGHSLSSLWAAVPGALLSRAPWTQAPATPASPARRSPALTVALLLALTLLVALVARAVVQAPVQEAAQQRLLLAGQFSGGRGDEAAPVLLEAVLPLPAVGAGGNAVTGCSVRGPSLVPGMPRPLRVL